jgi:hypothetical protein
LGAHDSFREDNLPNTNKFFSVKRPDHTGQPAGELGASEIRTGQPSRRPAAPPTGMQNCRHRDWLRRHIGYVGRTEIFGF